MKIIVIGAGEVGFLIAERLVVEQHDVVIIDKDPEKILEINRGLDVLTVIGQGSDFDVLDKAGIRDCDILIAATNVDEINMVACFIAMKLNVPLKIARIRGYIFKNGSLVTKEELGIDELINPEEVAAEDILNLIDSPAAFEIADFSEEGIAIKGYRITSGMIIKNIKLLDLGKFADFRKMLLLSILREEQIIIPKGEDQLTPDDKVYIIGKSEDFPSISRYFHESYKPVKYLFIIGVNRISRILCKRFQELGIRVKVIEKDRNLCLAFSEEYHKTEIVNCNPTDLEALKEEGLDNIDVFLALSDDEKTNILSCMIAKKQKVAKTIAKIQKNEFLPFTTKMGIDAVVNPKLCTVGKILKYARPGNILAVDTLGEMNAEAIEFLVSAKNQYINIPLKDIQFPKGMIIAAIIRGNRPIIPKGDDWLQIKDKVLVFTLPGVKKINNLFV